ncbi:MAG: translation initiation factor IF-2 [Cyclobacteriaceae bacterium]|nr:translation initiation factor IF-2 [Cyclobacteriaceae bacterium]
MSEQNTKRLSQVARKLNVGRDTIIEFLASKGIEIDRNPNAKITGENYSLLAKEFAESLHDKEEAESIVIGVQHQEKIEPAKESAPTSLKQQEEDNILIKNLSATKIQTSTEKEEKAEKAEPTSASSEALETPKKEEPKTDRPKLKGLKVVDKIDLEPKKKKTEPAPTATATAKEKKEKPVKVEEPIKVETKAKEEPKATEEEPKPEAPQAEEKTKVIKATAEKVRGLNVLGKIELPKEVAKKKHKPVASSDTSKKKRPRKRIGGGQGQGQGNRPSGNRDFKRNDRGGKARLPDKQGKSKRIVKEEPTDKEIQEQIKATLARLSGGGRGRGGKKGAGAKYRKEKRDAAQDAKEEQMMKDYESAQTLQVAEFISANDLASLMGVSVNDVISTCMGLGMFVSINQRLDAEAITVIADEFHFEVEFASAEDEVTVEVHQDTKDELEDRAPIVTIMGHVDHGKTSLLDYIRKSSVTSGEAGGITQHIGAYNVTTETGHKIAFLDTPGHEAFTAMRARGTKITDVVIIVIAADDSVMPQTKEAINHAQVAGVPIIIAFNKMDRPNANADKVREELSQMNVMVESWGGKYQEQEISAKTGAGINDLLEKVLLEAELLELKANPNKNATGSVIEAALDKGRGYITTIMVQEGTLKVGDVLLAGSHFGKVKAMFDHTGTKVTSAGPATPVQMLGLGGAPQAGDVFNVMDSDREAREIANKREQILREQSVRTKKHITLDEIGRRLAIGSFKELNIILKGDVDGSIEALSDSLQKLTTEEVQVNIIHKAVGQISESDVLLATASDAIILGFQVRPSPAAKRIAETEAVEIRLYSIIYDAINDIKDAMEGMLDPDTEEIIVGNVEIREVFKITKVGTVAGCMVIDGYVKRNNPIRLIRDGIVVYEGEMGQLKRFKDDVQEVKKGFECGLSIKNFNDIKMGDVVESYETREVKRKL